MLHNKKGFTIIELVVVVGIIGVLAAIAIPMYSNYRANAYRASAQATLVEGAQNMERYFTRNNSYAGAAIGAEVQASTEAGKYTLSFPAAPTAAAFTIRATPSFTEAKCGYLEITQTGAKSSEIAGNCW